MWQMKANKIPYESIEASETIIWNVVKKDVRPDTMFATYDKSYVEGKTRTEVDTYKCSKSETSSLQSKFVPTDVWGLQKVCKSPGVLGIKNLIKLKKSTVDWLSPEA